MIRHCIKYINKKGSIVRNDKNRKDLLRCLEWSDSKTSKINYTKNNLYALGTRILMPKCTMQGKN